MDQWLVTKQMPVHLIAACGLVMRDGKVLLLRSKRRGWEFPGRTIEQGESILAGLSREIEEETGYQAEAAQLVGVYQNLALKEGYGPLEGIMIPPITTFAFVCKLTGGEAKCSDESEEIRWVTPEEATRVVTYPTLDKRLKDMLAAAEDEQGIVFSTFKWTKDTKESEVMYQDKFVR